MITMFYFIVFLLALFMTGSFLVRNKNVDTVYILFSILVTINCLGRYMLASAETLEIAIWANRFLYVGGCYAPLLTVIILSRLSSVKMPKWLLGFLMLYSTIIMGFVLTIGKGKLYYSHVALGHGNGFNYLEKGYGPFQALYPVMMVLYAVVMIIYMVVALKKREKISFRVVITICIVGFSIFFMYIMERLLRTDLSFLSVGYLIGILFMNRYFERVKMYDMSTNVSGAVEKMKDYGYIVFDTEYHYLNSNEFVRELFPEMEGWHIDKKVPCSDSELYRNVIEYLYQWDESKEEKKYIAVNESWFQVEIRGLSYGKKENIGYLLEFVDRTLERKHYNSELLIQTVAALSDAVDAKDRYTSGHSKRVAEYGRMIAGRMGKTKEEQEEIYRAGLLHDVGKIRIPAEIINKPGKLTDEEYNTIKIHSVTGYHILRGIAQDSQLAIAAKYHHERYDGKGYPNGLAGDKIPEIARILGVADAYDAMASNRSYRNALPQEVVRSEIEKGRGTQFDPAIADIMLQIMDEDTGYAMKQTDSMHRTILTVDDEPMNYRLITHIMKDEPMYEIVSAGSGEDALERLKEQQFDLIFLDVMMPGMDGLETLRRIREHYQTPVVLMTGDKTLDVSAGFSALGCDDYITKPFLPLLIREVVHNMTERTSIES